MMASEGNKVFVVSKSYLHQATLQGMIAACERSLKRLKIDRMDLCLLHWRGSVPLQETLEGFDALVRAGKIRYWGVSNFEERRTGGRSGLPCCRTAPYLSPMMPATRCGACRRRARSLHPINCSTN
jgi:hypothetical protein